MAIIALPKSILLAVFAITSSVKVSSAFLIPAVEFGGCIINLILENLEKFMPDLTNTCKNQTSTLNITHGLPQDCTNKCLLEQMGVFDLENKLNVTELRTFYERHTNASKEQIEKLCSLHETCNVETSKAIQTLKESGGISIGNCRYYGFHGSCVYPQYKVVAKNDTLKLC